MTYKIYNEPSYFIIKTEAREISCPVDLGDDALSGFRVKNILGINITPNETYIDCSDHSLLSRSCVTEISHGNGEWFAYAESQVIDESKHLFMVDRYGYSPAFYAFIPGEYFIVSNSFHGVIAALDELEIPRSLNLENYALSLSSNTPTFQNIHSSETMCRQVSILSQEFAILIGKQTVELINRDSLMGEDRPKTYEKNLAKGIELARNVLQQIGNLEGHNRRITLSGGIDSRLVVGLLSTTSELSRYSVSTIDPRKWGERPGAKTIKKDMVLSNEVREKFKLSWWSLADRYKISQSFLEALLSFQSYRSNFAYTFKASSVVTIFEKPVITLRGGGGETIRTDATIAKMAAQFEVAQTNASPLILDQAEWYADAILATSILTGDLKRRSRDQLIHVFREAKGENFFQKINDIYFNFRYRAHFGHQRHSTSTNDLIVHPLSNPFFLTASRLVKFEDLNSGFIAKNMFGIINAELLDIPFENEQWNTRIGSVNQRSVDLDSNEWHRDLDRDTSIATSPSKFGREPGSRSEHYNFNSHKSGLNFLRQGFSVLEENLTENERGLVKNLHAGILKRAQSSTFNIGYSVAKLASALDVFYAQTATGGRYRLDCTSHTTNRSSQKFIVTSPPPIASNGFHNIVAGEFTVRASVSADRIDVAVVQHGYVTPLVEYAFYLYADNQKIETIWYQNNPAFSFQVPVAIMDYQIECFIRTKSDSRLVSVIKTDKLHLEGNTYDSAL